MENPTHLIIGAGPSSIMLCRTILEKGHNIILIEKGSDTPFTESLHCSEPILWGTCANITGPGTRHLTAKLSSCMDKAIQYNQGSGSGGSTLMNSMIFSAGSPQVFDQFWPKSWSSQVLERILKQCRLLINPTETCAEGNMKRLLNAALQPEAKLRSENDVAEHIWPWDLRPSVWNYFSTTSRLNPSDQLRRINLAELLDEYCSEQQSHVNEDRNKSFEEFARFGKLKKFSNVEVIRIKFSDSLKAESVETKCCRTGLSECIQPHGGGEIILCAGVFETPRILLASGLGSCACHSSSSVNSSDQRLPQLDDIGATLQDHVVLPMMWLGNWWGNSNKSKRATPGRDRFPANGVHGWIYLDEKGEVWNMSEGGAPPSAQLLLIDGRISPGLVPELLLPRLDPAKAPFFSTYVRPSVTALLQLAMRLWVVRWLCGFVFGFLVCVVRPHSTGRLLEDATNPGGHLVVDLGFLSDERDLNILRQAAATARRLVRTVCQAGGLLAIEVLPGPLLSYCPSAPVQASSSSGSGGNGGGSGNSHDPFRIFAQLFCSTYFHACGSCPMATTLPTATTQVIGEDDTLSAPAAEDLIERESRIDGSLGSGVVDAQNRIEGSLGSGVVDAELRVRGVGGLRIADASVVPRGGIPCSPIMATCMAIGVMAGELILQSADKKRSTGAVSMPHRTAATGGDRE